MPTTKKNASFPTITKAERTTLDQWIAAMVRVFRPNLVTMLSDGTLDKLEVFPSGFDFASESARAMFPACKVEYCDESPRKRNAECGKARSQAETIRIYVRDRICRAWEQAFGESYPFGNLAWVESPNDGCVEIWRIG